MEFGQLLFICLVFLCIFNTSIHADGASMSPTNHRPLSARVRIYSNLVEIIQPLDGLPLQFSIEEWSSIRADSLTLIGSNVNVTQQTITEKKESLNNHQVYVRAPSSSTTDRKFLQATMIDEKTNLVQLIDTNISKEPIFYPALPHDFIYLKPPGETKIDVDFTYDATDQVFVSYLSSTLNWKATYQLYLFEESMDPILIVMADIRNERNSEFDIENGELLAGDINLHLNPNTAFSRYPVLVEDPKVGLSLGQVQEVAGLYAFPINQRFSIAGKTNYGLPMFRPRIRISRTARIHKSNLLPLEGSIGKAKRRYYLSSDHFLPRGTCIVREHDHLVGETTLPNLPAEYQHEFSLGEDSDIVYDETVTWISSESYNETVAPLNTVEKRTRSIYQIRNIIKNFKKNRSVKLEFKQTISARSVNFSTSNDKCAEDGNSLKCNITLAPEQKTTISYSVEAIE